MATQTAGIQQLLAAEKKAADTVGEARKSINSKNWITEFRKLIKHLPNLNRKSEEIEASKRWGSCWDWGLQKRKRKTA